jgi:type I restriction enzyme S subunit
MFKVTRGYVLPATDASEEISDEMPYPVYSSQTKDNGLMGYYSDYLYEDAITWTTDGANAGTVNFRYGRFYCTNVCGVLLSNKVEASKAVAEALNNVAKRYVSYVGNPKLMNNVMADIQIKIPTSREERAKISSYFFTLDHLITLHQRKRLGWLKVGKNDWEQRKLGDVFEEYSEKGHKELPALTIIQGGGTLKREDSDRNLMYDESNLANYKMVHKDDFIVHLRSFEGGLEKSSLDGIISPAYHTFHSEEVDSRFYYSYFRSYEFIKHKLVPHVYGIRDGRSIDIEGMKSIEIPYTLRAEQKKIGDCLEVLDHLITLHQQK